MPKIQDDKLQMYFASGGLYYPLWQEANKLYNGLRVHADGDFPGEMIKDRRPSEPLEIVAYREKVYKPITKLPISKVIMSFSKIRRSPDWNISFPAVKNTGIPDEETLEQYCNNHLPGYGSITDWAFGILLKQNLIDANAVVAVIPLKEIVDNEFTQPVPILFNSDQIIEYKEREKWCILRSKRKTTYMDAANINQMGDIFYYIDDKEIVIFEQQTGGFMPVTTIKNTIGQMPVYKLKAEAYKQFDGMSLNRSRLDAMVPFLDEAACEYSDLMGSKIQHLYPLFWFYQDGNCPPCKGIGKITSPGAQPVTCKQCEGTGRVKFSPFAHMQVSPATLGKSAAPTPPAGYVTRDTAILELQEKSVEKNNFKALSAVNMQFLDQTPLAISGDAKNVDREELNNTVYNSAEDLIASIDRAIYFMNEWRNVFFIKSAATRRAMLPNIPVPQNFDLLPEDYLMKEVADAKGKLSPFMVATLEQQLAAKKFYNHPDLAVNIKLYFDLDPLPGVSVDEKITQLTNQGITKEDFIISNYMAQFVRRAIREDKDFQKKTWDEQMKKMVEYAGEKIAANDEAQKLIDAAQKKQAIITEMQTTPPAAKTA